jgi:hypothetical protein
MANGIASMEAATTVKVGDKVMTIKEYKAYVKAKKNETLIAKGRKPKEDKPKKRKKGEVKEISAVAWQIEKMMKPITTLKSFAAYYDHAYRQWGNIAKDILNLREIRQPFVFYRVKISELERLIADIEKMAKRNEKAAYQYVEKIAWKLDDIKTDITNINNGIQRSGVIQQHKSHECINGTGRRLGLQTLVGKSFKAMSQLEDVIGTLKKIADDGTDPFMVGDHMSPKSRSRCWA